MASLSNEQFLFSCIDNSNGGTVDWEKVAEECGIVSKGAAAIKYKRMKTKFGSVTQGAAAAAGDDASPGDVAEGKGKKGKKAAPTKKTTPKKRKLAKSEEDDAEDVGIKEEDEGDDDE